MPHTTSNPHSITTATTQALFIKLKEVKTLTTLSTSEIYRRISAGTFPSQIMLGPKSAVWIEAEIRSWCEARILASRMEVA